MKVKQVQELVEKTNHLLCKKDMAVLFKYASKVPDGGIIVDIGTAGGGSAFVMAMASKPNVKVFTIDPNRNETFFHWRKEFNLEDKITYFEETSEEAVKHFQSADVDMMFVDGIHSYHGVMEDFDNWGKRVKTGSVVAFHDVILYDNTIGAAVNELISQGKIKHLETVVDKYQLDPRDIGLLVGEKI